MAVLDLVAGLTAEILINGSPSLEYDDPNNIQVEHKDRAIRDYQARHTCSKYIESKSGQKFSIRMKVGRPLGHKKMAHAKLTMDIEVDGIPVWTLICDRPWFNKNLGPEWEGISEGPKNGKGHSCTVREFSFLKIRTNSHSTDSAKVRDQAQRMKKKGTIVIKVYNATAGIKGGSTINASEANGFLKMNEATVSEMAVKGTAKSHATALGKAKKTARGAVARCEKKDGPDYPIAIFQFLYRDLDSLKQLHIIPRTPSPTPPPEVRSRSSSIEADDDVQRFLSSLSGEKLRGLKRALGMLDSQDDEMQSERKGIRTSKKIKKETEEKPERRGLGHVKRGSASKLAVIVDLTGEDDEPTTDDEGDGRSPPRRHKGGEDSDDDEGLFVRQ
ncbi:hypothetical protein BKA64DRAFT_756325 [Cadophora sp. MPI-SDFR-AT-0126]|nr:hypothetical protein BKA64DRAFT_756325 [Leotiomycetes sp. MPI-SDFR-AT-0126]